MTVTVAISSAERASFASSMAVVARDADGSDFHTLEGLAEMWEAEPSIRQLARRSRSLLEWTDAESVGVPSVRLFCN